MSKKIKMIIYIVGVVWIMIMSQVLIRRLFISDKKILDAFENTDTNIEESKLNLVVDLGEDILSNAQRVDVMKGMAKAVGIEEYQIKTETTKDSVNLTLKGKSSLQNTEINVISLSHKKGTKTSYHHFVLLEMKLKEHFGDIIETRKETEKYILTLGIKDYQYIMKFSGNYQGKLSEEQINLKVNKLLQNLQARKVDSVKSDSYYSVYAYTGLVKDYIKVDGNRININVVVNYNEECNKTEIYLATPVLNDEY